MHIHYAANMTVHVQNLQGKFDKCEKSLTICSIRYTFRHIMLKVPRNNKLEDESDLTTDSDSRQ